MHLHPLMDLELPLWQHLPLWCLDVKGNQQSEVRVGYMMGLI